MVWSATSKEMRSGIKASMLFCVYSFMRMLITDGVIYNFKGNACKLRDLDVVFCTRLHV